MFASRLAPDLTPVLLKEYVDSFLNLVVELVFMSEALWPEGQLPVISGGHQG